MNVIIGALVVTLVAMGIMWAVYTMASDTAAPKRFWRHVGSVHVYDTFGSGRDRTASGAETLWGIVGFVVIVAVIAFVATNV